MNSKNEESYRSLQLLDEISKEDSHSQRALSDRLGIAVGLVNSYLKNMVAKGYVRVKSYPRNRYTYLLTPKGIAEKSRLTYAHLSYFTGLYTTARKDFRDLFDRLEKKGVKKVVFCGVDEVAEIAYLSIQETDLEMAGVVDSISTGSRFFGYEVAHVGSLLNLDFDKVVITSFKRASPLLELLQASDMDNGKICRL